MKKILYIIIIIILLGSSLVFAFKFSDNENNNVCIKKLNPYKPTLSRVAENDTREKNRQYYYNNSWIKLCNNT